jgi:hypothetical protein
LHQCHFSSYINGLILSISTREKSSKDYEDGSVNKAQNLMIQIQISRPSEKCTQGHLVSFQFLTIIKKAAMNIVEHVSLLHVEASFGYMPNIAESSFVPRTHSVIQVALHLNDLPASVSQVLVLSVCTTMSS